VDIYMMCEPDIAVPLLDAVKPRPGRSRRNRPLPEAASDVVSIRTLADALNAATKDVDVCITRLPLGWNGVIATSASARLHRFGGRRRRAGRHHRGRGARAQDSGGSGRVMATRFPHGATALWTAAHYAFLPHSRRQQPLFFNDELHQERVAKDARARWRTAGSASASADRTSTSR